MKIKEIVVEHKNQKSVAKTWDNTNLIKYITRTIPESAQKLQSNKQYKIVIAADKNTIQFVSPNESSYPSENITTTAGVVEFIKSTLDYAPRLTTITWNKI